jgi:hypothetical protein
MHAKALTLLLLHQDGIESSRASTQLVMCDVQRYMVHNTVILAWRRRRSSSGWYGTKGSAAAGDACRKPHAGLPLLARSPSTSSQVSSTRSCAKA